MLSKQKKTLYNCKNSKFLMRSVMKKAICPICGAEKGKRKCQIENNAVICVSCCESSLSTECQGCPFYHFGDRENQKRHKKSRRDKY